MYNSKGSGWLYDQNIGYCQYFIIMRHLAPFATVSLDPYVEDSPKPWISLHQRTAVLNTAWHMHSKGQLLYAEDGVTRLYTTNSSFLLPARHCAWIPAHQVHMVSSSSPSLFLRTLYLTIEPTLTHSFYQELSVFQVSDLLREMIIYTERWVNRSEADKEERAFMEALKLILPDLQGASLGLRLPASRHPRVQAIMNLVLQDMSKRISIEQLAENMGLSTRTISRLFQQELGMSFAGFLKVARIIKAIEILSLPGANVAETAYMVGYESVPSFSNSFFEVVGYRPHSFMHKPQNTRDT